MSLNTYRNPKLIRQAIDDLYSCQQTLKIMEVCGTHTMSIAKWGIRKLIPSNISLLSGPGCPICVTPASVIDGLMELSNSQSSGKQISDKITIAVFGDLLRVPGSQGTLEKARAEGADIRIVYSPLDALKLAQTKETVFAGIGFETTIPGIAYTILEAEKQNAENFSVLSCLKLIPPALDALLSDNEVDIQGFILPGHVSIITGMEAYRFLVDKYQTGGVITGFEPLDIILAIKKLTDLTDNPQIINEYTRVVTSEGNKVAGKIMAAVFKVTDSLWRGLGWIRNSGLEIREKYSRFDAIQKYGLTTKFEDFDSTPFHSSTLPPFHLSCRCCDVLRGIIIPTECTLFKKYCKPDNPIGPCMVSSEGSCAAYYHYE